MELFVEFGLLLQVCISPVHGKYQFMLSQTQNGVKNLRLLLTLMTHEFNLMYVGHDWSFVILKTRINNEEKNFHVQKLELNLAWAICLADAKHCRKQARS